MVVEMIDNKKIAMASTNKVLELTILPTLDCNFRCKYCYIAFEKFKMTHSSVESIRRLLRKKVCHNGFLYLRINWFGGEPLICKDIIYEINKYALSLSKIYDFKFDSGITTNGSLLTESTVDKLIKLRINHFQITLDGDESNHNELRPFKNGKGSYGKIINSLYNLRNSYEKFECMIRFNVTPKNLNSVKNLINSGLNEFKSDKRFILYPVKVGNLSGTLDMALLTNNSDKIFDNVIPDNYICYASKLNSLVIMPDLTLKKCTVKLEDDSNTVGRLTDNGEIIYKMDRIKYWSRGLISKDRDVLQCPARSKDTIYARS